MADPRVSLVVPGRNCSTTIRPCLDAAVAILDRPDSPLGEILFVDDGSTDDTAEIVSGYPAVRLVLGPGRGAGAARNLGWRTAEHELIWFIDSDCVTEPEALERLLPALREPDVGAVGGSYGIMNAHSLLACLIHEEIVERHLAMPESVNFLATFNVLYRREALQRVDGFDEQFLKGQDAELSFRVMAAGFRLRFTIESKVRHFHEERLGRYLRTQRQQGYWRVWLHLRHSGHARGDSYSGLIDHVQPPLAVLIVLSIPLALVPYGWPAPVGLTAALACAQLPFTLRLLRRCRRPKYALFAALGFIRAFARGAGMTAGLVRYLLDRPAARGGVGSER